MRSLWQWLCTALIAQPFYSEEIRGIRLACQMCRHRLPHLAPFDPNA